MSNNTNPILNCVLTMADLGWHVHAVAARRVDGQWVACIDVQDNVPDGWTWEAVGGIDASQYRIIAPPVGPLDGVPGVTVQHWINRPGPYQFPLPPESADIYEQWIAEVARAGHAPDWAWLGDGHILTKPIEWLVEPLRSALLRKYRKADHGNS